MASIAASTRREGEGLPLPQKQCKRRCRRLFVVAVSALSTIALFAAYCAADIVDVLPGPLTLTPVAVPEFADPETARAAGFIIGDLDSDKPVDSSSVNAAVNDLLATDGIGSDTSVIVADTQGDVLAEHAADTPREPASTMKTLTALAASATLDMASTLDTQVLLTQDEGGSATVHLKGNGDMLLSAGESDPDHVNGRAGLDTLASATASALAQRGIDSVQLGYDDTLFGDERTPVGIERNNGDYLYYTPVSSMAIDGGRQYSETTPKPANPDDATDYPVLSQTTAADTAAVFAKLLESRGITVTQKPKPMDSPQDVTPIASVSSATLAEILSFMLRHSDNTLAEEFGRLTALARHAGNSPTAATQAVRAALGELGIDTTGLHMADCSGLTPGSTLTVRTLVAVQSRNLTTGVGAAAAEGLSVAGLVGTAASRYTDDAVAGLLRVKTGSLESVTSMAGNISRINGGALSFAVIVNNPEDYSAARSAIDAFATALAKL